LGSGAIVIASRARWTTQAAVSAGFSSGRRRGKN
jgi:hypothetical protein